MVEADSHLKLLTASILDTCKVFEHVDMLSIGIQEQPYTFIHSTWLRFWGSESKWRDYVMVQADSNLKLLPASILDTYEHIDTICSSMGNQSLSSFSLTSDQIVHEASTSTTAPTIYSSMGNNLLCHWFDHRLSHLVANIVKPTVLSSFVQIILPLVALLLWWPHVSRVPWLVNSPGKWTRMARCLGAQIASESNKILVKNFPVSILAEMHLLIDEQWSEHQKKFTYLLALEVLFSMYIFQL